MSSKVQPANRRKSQLENYLAEPGRSPDIPIKKKSKQNQVKTPNSNNKPSLDNLVTSKEEG